jgi:hypothetical protein
LAVPKKKQALPTPKAKLYTEDAALLVPIFQREPFITFQELQAKYGDILTDQQIYRGLLGTFAPYVSERREEAFQEQLLQAKQAALQLEILSHPVGGSLTMPETEVRSLARASFNSMLDGMPAGMACYITCAVNAMYAGDVSGLKNEPLSERMLLSSANQGPLEKYSMQTDSIFRNLPKLLPEEENEVYVGKSAGKNVSTIVTMDFPKTIALDNGGSLTSFDKAILNGVSSLLIAGTIYFTIPMLYRAMIGSARSALSRSVRQQMEEAVRTIRDRLEFMRHATITLDCTEEAAAHFIKEGQNLQSLTLSQYLLPMNRMNAVLNGREVEAYFLIDTPPLFQYASSKRQISLVDMDLLNVHFEADSPLAGASLNNTPAIIVLKNYLLTRIEGMKNPNNRLQSRKILFSSIYEELGEPSPIKQRRQRLRNYTEIYLEYLTQQNYISGYSFTRTGRVVDGVEIVLDRTTRKPAPTPELTLPDETNKGRFKPNKQKTHKRNVIR